MTTEKPLSIRESNLLLAMRLKTVAGLAAGVYIAYCGYVAYFARGKSYVWLEKV